jgi:hypothetical protein
MKRPKTPVLLDIIEIEEITHEEFKKRLGIPLQLRQYIYFKNLGKGPKEFKKTVTVWKFEYDKLFAKTPLECEWCKRCFATGDICWYLVDRCLLLCNDCWEAETEDRGDGWFIICEKTKRKGKS